MRLGVYYLLNIQLDSNSKYSSPSEMMPFDFDNDINTTQDTIPEYTENDWLALDTKFNNLLHTN
jgi:hypothetical protein